MDKKAAFTIPWVELTALAVFLLLIIPLIKIIFGYVTKSPGTDVQNQFRSLVADINALPDSQAFYGGYYFNKNKENYKLTARKACTANQKPEKDSCLPKAMLCLVHIRAEQKPICEEFENINFKTDNEDIKLAGTKLGISKDKNGIVEISSQRIINI